MIISYYWPPSGGSGVQRWMYFSKYLQQLGWHPHVLTVDSKSASYSVLDPSLLNEVSTIELTRTNTKEPLRWYSFLTSASTQKGIPQGQVKTKSLFGKMAAFIRGNFFIPDARIGWRSYALKAALRLMEEHLFSYVITTGPPHSSHWVGLQLKQRFDVKWFVDFRDPWTDVFYNQFMYRTQWAKKRDLRQEREILQKANAVITTVAGDFHKELQSKAPNQHFYALPNGFDAELMQSVSGTSHQVFHVVYTGLLTENQNYHCVIEALKKWQHYHQIQLSIAGQVSNQTLTALKNDLPKIAVENHGYVSHRDAIALMKSADLLLNFIFEGAHKMMLSGKLLEYIATGVPILSIGDPDSEAGRFLKQGNATLMALPHQKKAIDQFIEQAIVQKGQWKNTHPHLEVWTREAITQKLIRILSST